MIKKFLDFFKRNKISNLGEFGLIENIKSWINEEEKFVDNIIGIGDDAAVISFDKDEKVLASTDTFVEGVHFTRDITSFFDLGWRVLAANASDIAAMGGTPKYVMISLACPVNTKIDDIRNFYFGFKKLADILDIKLIGGDTVKLDKKIVVSISILGNTLSQNYILRNSAENGNLVFATGTFGDSAFGLKELLKNKNIRNFFTERFNNPMPRVKEGKFLGRNNLATCMMDVSDGLAFTLNEIAYKSNLGILLYEDKIPYSKEMKNTKDKLSYALYGGEDFELIFCARKENLDKILSFGNISLIGEVKDDFLGVKILDNKNKLSILPRKGYRAF